MQLIIHNFALLSYRGRGFGIFFILLGSTVYTWTKEREHRAREAIASHGRSAPLVVDATAKGINAPSTRSKGASVMNNLKKLIINTSSSAVPNGGNQSSSTPTDTEKESGLPSPGPRTPRHDRAVFSNQQHQYLQSTGLSPATAAGRRLSYNGPRNSPGSRIDTSASVSGSVMPSGLVNNFSGNSQGHNKAVSVTDLRDILITPNDRTKEAKVC